MKCETTQKLIEKLVSGTITDQELKELHIHTENCAICSDILDKASFSTRVFDKIEDVQCPSKLNKSIMSTLKSQGAFKKKSNNIINVKFFNTTIFKAAVSIAAVFILVVMLFSGEKCVSNDRGDKTNMVVSSDKFDKNSTPKNSVISVDKIIDYECKVLLAAPGCFFKTATNQWKPLSTGALLQKGYSLKTNNSSQLIIQYKDMTEVRIKPDSHVIIDTNALKIKKGATWLKVTKKESRFEITTPTCVAGVLGTRLGVCITDKMTSCVSVFQGKVMVTAAKNYNKKASEKPVFLLANEKIFSAAEKGLSRKCYTANQEENLWMNGNLALTTDYTMPSIKTNYCSLPSYDSSKLNATTSVDSNAVNSDSVTRDDAKNTVESNSDDDRVKTVIYGSMNAMDNDIEEE